MGLPDVRILEIGDQHHFKETLPEQTQLLWTGRRRPTALRRQDYADCTPRAFARAMHDVSQGKFDIMIAYANQRSPWHPRYWLRAMFSGSPLAAIRVFGVAWLRRVRMNVPMAAIDMYDIPSIHRTNIFLLDKARFFFKRELPVDRWQAFIGAAHPLLPTLRIRGNARWQNRLAKLQPISSQAGLIDLGRPDADVFAAKNSDVFFAGGVQGNSTVRAAGLRQLQQLKDRGFKIDIPTERVSPEEFRQRMSRSWLAWSPSGLGWDCYRHYEAPQCLAVPVIDYPTIARYRPLRDGVHALYYDPEDDGLSQAIEAALADKEKLKAIAVAGRAHVRAHHAGPAFCKHVLELTLQEAAPSCSSPGSAASADADQQRR